MRLITAVLLVATSAMAAGVRFDARTGLWFPPYGTAEEYLAGKKSYVRDVHRAFGDPLLRRAVCTAFDTTKVASDGRVRQLATMFTMACGAFASKDAVENQQRKIHPNAVAHLDAAMEAAIGFVETIPEARRREAQQEHLRMLAPGGNIRSDEEWTRTVMRAIALRPRDARGAWHLLTDNYAQLDLGNGNTVPEQYRPVWVERLYRRKAASDPEWSLGLPEVLLYLGKIPEARHMQQARLGSGQESSRFAYLLMGWLEEISGDRASATGAIAVCENEGEESDLTCAETMSHIAMRTLEALGTRAPRAAIDGAVEVSRVEHDNWPMRLAVIRELAVIDPALGEQEELAIANDSIAPWGAVVDSVRQLARMAAKQGAYPRAAALIDHWLALHEVKLPPFPQDGWRRVADMPENVASPEAKQPCFTDLEQMRRTAQNWDCTMGALEDRLTWAIEGRQWELARQSVEQMVAHAASQNMTASVIRRGMRHLASELHTYSHQPEAETIRAYLDGRAAEPWTAPTSPSLPRIADASGKLLPTNVRVDKRAIYASLPNTLPAYAFTETTLMHEIAFVTRKPSFLAGTVAAIALAFVFLRIRRK